MKFYLLITVVLIGSFQPNVVQAAGRRLCTNTNGAVIARSKCKRGETVLTLNSVANLAAANIKINSGAVGPIGEIGAAGPAGPQGKKGPTSITAGPRGILDFSGCHRIVSGPATISGQISLAANCDSVNEFLYDDEWSITGSKAFIQNITKNTSLGSNNEKIPYGIEVMTNNTAGGDYTLSVKALCCPR